MLSLRVKSDECPTTLGQRVNTFAAVLERFLPWPYVIKPNQ